MFKGSKKGSGIIQYAYYISIVLPFLCIALLLYFVSPLCLFALPCVWTFVKYVSTYFFSKIPSEYTGLKKENTHPSEKDAVLAVICSVLYGEERDKEIFDRLELIYNANSGKNIYFGVLGDLCDFRCARASSDESILEYAYGRIDALNKKYGYNFVLFERPRIYSKGEDVFMPRERRRGAVLELVNFLRQKNCSFSEKSQNLAREVLKDTNIKYVVTLDRDTEIPLNAVISMYEHMRHDANDPKACCGKAKVGYALMQPHIRYKCKTETAFSKIFTDIESDEDDQLLRQKIFGKADFSGNGIIDIDTFANAFDTLDFPEDTVLSHTFPEGALLDTAFLPDITFTKEFPENQVEYLKKQHKKVREDIQNLLFLFKRYPAFKSMETWLKLIDKVIGDLAPCFAFLCIFISAFTSAGTRSIILSFSLSYIFVPAVFGMFQALFYLFRSKKAFLKNLYSIPRAIFSVSMLAQNSLCTFSALSKGLYRMLISKRKLLEKLPEHEENAATGLLDFVHRNIFSAFCSFLLFAFAAPGILYIISLLWLAFPVISHLLSLKIKLSYKPEEKKLLKKQSLVSGDLAKKIPEESANLTSPKGIGLHLLSVLVLRDFEFITTKDMMEKLSYTLSFLFALPRWRGLIFNSYDIGSITPKAPLKITSSDIGILCACLITLREGLREYVCESTSFIDIIAQIEKFENSMDIISLFDSKKNLFYKELSICKDKSFIPSDTHLEASCGSLLLNYIACARRLVPEDHLKLHGHTFKGTFDKSLLPYMFLPLKKGKAYYKRLLSQNFRKCYPEIYLALLCNEKYENRLCERFLKDGKMGCGKYLFC